MGCKYEVGDVVRKLDEAALAYRVAGRGSRQVKGWVRTVRQAMGLPVRELAERLGVTDGEVFRLEDSERAGTIGLAKLRAAAEGLGCELVYGLAPKEGTLTGMAAALEAGREQRRAEARAWRLRKAKEKRCNEAIRVWEKQRRERERAQRLGYWRVLQEEKPEGLRLRRPKRIPIDTEFAADRLRRAIKQEMRRRGIRFR